MAMPGVLPTALALIQDGYRLLCTDKLCSIFDPAPDKKTVRVIPLDGLKEMRVFEKKPTH